MSTANGHDPPMEDENCAVLAALVDRYDETEEPVDVATIAHALDRDEAAVRQRLGELVDCEFVAPLEEGYRPTVTGREFLALDIDCGPVVVDTDDE